MERENVAPSVFSIFPGEPDSVGKKVAQALALPVAALTGLRRLEAVYRKIDARCDAGEFMRRALSELHVRSACRLRDLAKIPVSGPCVVIANHPFGMVEGMILAGHLTRIRPDVKVMGNFLLRRIPQLSSLVLAVDPFERAGSVSANIRPLREAIRWVEQGGLLVIFPAGEVSHFRLSRGEIADPPWKTSLATILRHTRASVVPVFFEGQNSPGFQIAGMIHPRLRTALLVRELLKMQGKTISFKVGNPIPYACIKRYPEDEALLNYLRWRTYAMGHRNRESLLTKATTAIGSRFQLLEPVTAPVAPEYCAREVERLPDEQRLCRHGTLCVWRAEARQIPCLLKEIGRLREIAFRKAGEGTGKALDIDRYDAHYLHLFVWNEKTAEVVGAYRIVPTDRILKAMGADGLYTHTLFAIHASFYEKLGPALELGRSFVRPEYQKSYAPLFLLWKGIAQFIAQNPRYRMLLGPVSISSDYSDLSRRLLAATLLRDRQAENLALLVRPRRPAKLAPVRIRGCDQTSHDIDWADFSEVCQVVSDIEVSQKDVPVLLRHYVSLGGKLLSFNIDKSFSGVMDGLMVADLLETDTKTLERYMGTRGAQRFLAFHAADAGERRLSA